MGKIKRTAQRINGSNGRERLVRLRGERRALAVRLARLDEQISQLSEAPRALDSKKNVAVERWLDDLVDGLPELPALPTDWGRADLYDDHD